MKKSSANKFNPSQVLGHYFRRFAAPASPDWREFLQRNLLHEKVWKSVEKCRDDFAL